jgi:hypothetical protein
VMGQQNLKGLSGTPGPIRTADLLLRRQTLYPAELRAHSFRQLQFITRWQPRYLARPAAGVRDPREDLRVIKRRPVVTHPPLHNLQDRPQ